jgi:hypothetical protein
VIEFAKVHDGRSVKRNLFLGFTKRRDPKVLPRFLTAARETDLATVIAKVLRPTGQNNRCAAVTIDIVVKRSEHRRAQRSIGNVLGSR